MNPRLSAVAREGNLYVSGRASRPPGPHPHLLGPLSLRHLPWLAAAMPVCSGGRLCSLLTSGPHWGHLSTFLYRTVQPESAEVFTDTE